MKILIRWVLIYTAIFIIWLSLIHFAGIYTNRIQYADFVDTAAILMPIAILWLAFREEKKSHAGTFYFRRSMILGIGIGIIIAPISFGIMWVYHHYINPGWLTILVDFKRASLLESGLPLAEVSTRIDTLLRSGTDRAQLTGALIGNPLVFTTLSVIIASVMAISQKVSRKQIAKKSVN